MKSLDYNVEKKNLEGTYKNNNNSSKQELSSWDLLEQTRKRDEERKSSEAFARATGGMFGGYSGIGFSSLPKPTFTATDIGKATINTPTVDKIDAQRVENELETIKESSKDNLEK